MKIAFFVNYSHAAGTYFRWHNLALALKVIGHEVDVYAGDFDKGAKVREEVKDGLNYFIVPSSILARLLGHPNDPLTGIRRLGFLPRTRYDVYHLFQPFVQAYVPWLYLKSIQKSSIFLFDWDDLWTGGFFSNKPVSFRDWLAQTIVKYLERKAPHQSNGVTTCSQFLSDKINGTIAKTKIYNGFWPNSLPDKTSLRRKWNLQSDVFYLAFVGRTAQEMSWISEALIQLSNSKIDRIKLIVCGPPESVLAEYNMLNHPWVVYLGNLSTVEASEICCAADLGLIPLEDTDFNRSRFPIKFFDFLAVGTPVYLSEVGEIATIADSIHGAFKGSHAKDKWCEGTIEVVGKLKSEPVRFDLKMLEDKYSWPAIATQLSHFYVQLNNEKRKINITETA